MSMSYKQWRECNSGTRADFERVLQLQRAVDAGVRQILAAVQGTVFFNGDRTVALVLLDAHRCIIRVDGDGDTQSAYLSTVPPREIADALMRGEDEVSGWLPAGSVTST